MMMFLVSHPMHTVVKLIAGLLLFYAAWCTILFLMQRVLIYPRGYVGSPAPPDLDRLGIEQIWLDTAYGRIEAWFLPPETLAENRMPAPLVIFAHGNAELIDYNVDEMAPLRQMGLGVLMVEYPGYGRSGGSPSQESITAAFVAAYDLVLERKLADPAKIVLYGRSLGGGAVCALAARRPSAGLILMSTFTSVRSFAIRYGAPGFLVRDPFDNLSVIKTYTAPVLILHGKYDNVISYRHGLKLHAAAPNSTMIAYDCAHNDCPPDWQHFYRTVADFIAAIAGDGSPWRPAR